MDKIGFAGPPDLILIRDLGERVSFPNERDVRIDVPVVGPYLFDQVIKILGEGFWKLGGHRV